MYHILSSITDGTIIFVSFFFYSRLMLLFLLLLYSMGLHETIYSLLPLFIFFFFFSIYLQDIDKCNMSYYYPSIIMPIAFKIIFSSFFRQRKCPSTTSIYMYMWIFITNLVIWTQSNRKCFYGCQQNEKQRTRVFSYKISKIAIIIVLCSDFCAF